MNCKWKISISLALILLVAILFNNGLMPNGPKNLASAQESRTVNFKIYSFFDVPIDADVWALREAAYGVDYLISGTYPVVYLWMPDIGWNYYYTSVRVNVQGRNLPEITIDNPMFLPYNLMGNLEPGVTGGTAQIVNWHLFYVNSTRAQQLTPQYPPGQLDGYVTELTGKIILDKSAARKILGITEAQFDNFASWWAANKGTVKTKWSTWLTNLGGAGGAFDIRPMFEAVYSDFPAKYTYYLELESATPTSITLNVDMITNGMECLLARMFRATFMPGLEGFYDDLYFNATIRATSADVDLDTAWTWAMYMWSYNDTAFEEPTWMMEPIFGDYPDLAEYYGVTTSPAYPYRDKTYYIVTPGNDYYGQYGPYDYTPNCFNLREGETLTIDWSNTQAGPVWVFKQNPWTPPQTPNDTLTVVEGWLKFSLESSEPYACWIQNHPQINYNPTARTITFTGPINFTELSQQYMPEEWERIDGLLPWGCPLTEFKVVSDHEIMITEVTPNKQIVGQGCMMNINVTVINLGQHTETITVKIYANETEAATTTFTLESGATTTKTLIWDTAGFAKGNYTLWVYAWPVPGETDTSDNTFSDGIVYVGIPGDVNGDGIVEMMDFYALSIHFGHAPPNGHTPGTPAYTECYNADINDDGVIEMMDFYIASIHFGQQDP